MSVVAPFAGRDHVSIETTNDVPLSSIIERARKNNRGAFCSGKRFGEFSSAYNGHAAYFLSGNMWRVCVYRNKNVSGMLVHTFGRETRENNWTWRVRKESPIPTKIIISRSTKKRGPLSFSSFFPAVLPQSHIHKIQMYRSIQN